MRTIGGVGIVGVACRICMEGASYGGEDLVSRSSALKVHCGHTTSLGCLPFAHPIVGGCRDGFLGIPLHGILV